MKKLAGLLMLWCMVSGCVYAKVGVQMEPKVMQANDDSHELLRHVVLFKWKEGVDPAAIAAIEAGYDEMAGLIPEIHDLEWGRNIPANARNQGYSHCLLVTFKSEADLDAYAKHPEHNRFRDAAMPYVESIIVVDYWVE
ncbi:MAG: hypothetical protein AMXMBFR84_23900 [Candidatus Hydrogenedentota bacterium]